MEDCITLKHVKDHYKQDVQFIKTQPKLFIILLLTQNKAVRHWEYMWIKVIIGLCKAYFLALMYRFKFWIECILSGYFPWEIK